MGCQTQIVPRAHLVVSSLVHPDTRRRSSAHIHWGFAVDSPSHTPTLPWGALARSQCMQGAHQQGRPQALLCGDASRRSLLASSPLQCLVCASCDCTLFGEKISESPALPGLRSPRRTPQNAFFTPHAGARAPCSTASIIMWMVLRSTSRTPALQPGRLPPWVWRPQRQSLASGESTQRVCGPRGASWCLTRPSVRPGSQSSQLKVSDRSGPTRP